MFTEKKFWSKVNKIPYGCWEWMAGGGGGYGIVRYGGRKVGAHRVAWMITFGDISEGMFVCHRCDNPKCVRPGHLFIGTPVDNVRDMIAKGRRVIVPHDSYNAVITYEQAEEIRRDYVPRVKTLKYFAEKFGVSEVAVWYALKRVDHVTDWKAKVAQDS